MKWKYAAGCSISVIHDLFDLLLFWSAACNLCLEVLGACCPLGAWGLLVLVCIQLFHTSVDQLLFDPRTAQPVGSRYTDYATWPTKDIYIYIYIYIHTHIHRKACAAR